MTAISSGLSNGHAVDAYYVVKYGQRLRLGWTERAGVQLRSKAKIILINYLGAFKIRVFFLKDDHGSKTQTDIMYIVPNISLKE